MPVIFFRKLLLLAGLLALVQINVAEAFLYRKGDEVYLSGDFSEDVMLAGGTVKFEGTIWGDLLAAARTVTCDGIVDGNINAVGQRVTINGELCRSLRVGAQTININSKIDGDVVAFGTEVTFASEAYVARDLAVFGSEALIDGEVGSNASIHAGSITIGGKINGDLKCSGGRISLAPGAVIAGDFEYQSKEKARISPEAQILGETRWKKTTSDNESAGIGGWVPFPSSWLWSLAYLVGSIGLGAIIILSRRDTVLKITSEIQNNGPIAGILGVGVIFVAPIVFVLIAVTVIGIPAAIAGLTVYGLLFFIGKIMTGVTFGMILLRWIRRKDKVSLGWSLVLGMLLLALMFKIPIFGWLIYLVAWSVGAGATLFVFFRKRVQPTAELTPSTPS